MLSSKFSCPLFHSEVNLRLVTCSTLFFHTSRPHNCSSFQPTASLPTLKIRVLLLPRGPAVNFPAEGRVQGLGSALGREGREQALSTFPPTCPLLTNYPRAVNTDNLPTQHLHLTSKDVKSTRLTTSRSRGPQKRSARNAITRPTYRTCHPGLGRDTKPQPRPPSVSGPS